MKTYYESVQFIKNELANHYPEGEIAGFTSIIFDHLSGLSHTELHMKYQEEIPENDSEAIVDIIEKLKKNEPIQYILGETEFYDLNFKVAKGVLIPRQETEELVDWIIKENKDNTNLQILDIGTGSGCIPISLSKNIDCKEVRAFDNSKEALIIAKENAKINQSKISFKHVDILKKAEKVTRKKWDVIVSNPPYVTKSEKKKMMSNVLDHEPHQALFVDDEEPLLFYDAIACYAIRNLKEKGQLYFEINEEYGTEVFNMLITFGFEEVVLKQDIHGKDRMVKAVKTIL